MSTNPLFAELTRVEGMHYCNRNLSYCFTVILFRLFPYLKYSLYLSTMITFLFAFCVGSLFLLFYSFFFFFFFWGGCSCLYCLYCVHSFFFIAVSNVLLYPFVCSNDP